MHTFTAVALSLMLCFITKLAGAEDHASSEKLAERLLAAMQMEKQMQRSIEAMKAQMASTSANVMASLGQKAPAGTEPGPSSFMERMLEEMSYENIKSEYVAIYAELFTSEELKGLIAFYEGPIGQRWSEKQPEVMMRTMQISQNKMAKLMPLMMEEMKKNMPKGNLPASPPASE